LAAISISERPAGTLAAELFRHERLILAVNLLRRSALTNFDKLTCLNPDASFATAGWIAKILFTNQPPKL
jgi:hypothetical protein